MNLRNCCGWTLVAGVVLFALGLLCAFVAFPALIRLVVDINLDVWNKESEGYKNFMVPPVPIYMKIYFFEIQNPSEVADGYEKPVLKERGPYSYVEHRKKVNVSDHTKFGKEHIRFGQHKTFVFDPETSCEGCSDEDEVSILNVVLLALVKKCNEIPVVWQQCLSLMNTVAAGVVFPNYWDQLYMTVKVKDVLFDGVRSGLLDFALDSKLAGLFDLPMAVAENGFAFFNRKQNTSYNEWFQVNTGWCDRTRYMQIEKWGPLDGSRHHDSLEPLHWWKFGNGYRGSDASNKLAGCYDGQQFHPGVGEHETLYVYATDVCSCAPLRFASYETLKGIPAYRFIAPAKVMWTNFTANLGFVTEYHPEIDFDECAEEVPHDKELLNLDRCGLGRGVYPDGMRNLETCFKAPIWMSLPYFLNGPDYLREDVGLPDPVQRDHELVIYVEPITGMSIKLHKRVQFNSQVFRDANIGPLRYVQPVMHPILWIDEGAVVDDANADKMAGMVLVPVTLATVLQWMMVAAGVIAFVVAFACICLIERRECLDDNDDDVGVIDYAKEEPPPPCCEHCGRQLMDESKDDGYDDLLAEEEDDDDEESFERRASSKKQLLLSPVASGAVDSGVNGYARAEYV